MSFYEDVWRLISKAGWFLIIGCNGGRRVALCNDSAIVGAAVVKNWPYLARLSWGELFLIQADQGVPCGGWPKSVSSTSVLSLWSGCTG